MSGENSIYNTNINIHLQETYPRSTKKEMAEITLKAKKSVYLYIGVGYVYGVSNIKFLHP